VTVGAEFVSVGCESEGTKLGPVPGEREEEGEEAMARSRHLTQPSREY
jgi:hypothetical protein